MAMRAEDAPRSLVDNTANTSKRSVLLATGLGAPAFYIRNLRDHLRSEGHNAHTAHYPHLINTGTPDVRRAIREKAEKLRENTDEPLSGIGYSLGGNHLLEIAFDDPDLINQVFTLGSPSTLESRKKPDEVNVVSFVGGMGRVRISDGIVPSALANRADVDETIRVRPNHLLLPFSGKVFDAITHRLNHSSKNDSKLQRLA